MQVRAKKHLGQHFLKDQQIARRIVRLLSGHQDCKNVLEIGPGTGALTQYLLAPELGWNVYAVETDSESIPYLNLHFPKLANRLFEADFLKQDWPNMIQGSFCIIGNFPYNIGSQILFKVLEMPDLVPEIVCMLQKEVALRLASGPGNKEYGLLSVLLQAYYQIEFCFVVEPHVFLPPPKVDSGVLHLRRNDRKELPVNKKKFFQVVKQGFNTRRKTLRNALKPLNIPACSITHPLLDKRAEQLSVEDFFVITELFNSEKL